MWKAVGIIFLTVLVWTTLMANISLPNWTSGIFSTLTTIAMVIWFGWAGLAPRRLVRNRPEVAPPRPIAKARRDARAALNWRFILFALAISGAALFLHISSSDRSAGSWMWIIGSGTMFAVYLWIGYRKLTDKSVDTQGLNQRRLP
jgi:hypothetical protein